MDYLIWIPTIILFTLGLIGTIIPFMPGTLFISAGVLWQGIMGNATLTWWQWLILALMLAFGLIIDKVTGGVGARMFGSAKSGIIGALLGAIIGSIFFTPIIGILVCPFAGALLGEIIFSRKQIAPAIKAGAGATLGMISGIALEFLNGVLMISWFLICYFLF